MSIQQEEADVYIIPPNFIESGTLFGGTLKLRNAVEALGITLIIGIPEFHLPLALTTKITLACVTVLPPALFALIGINGESLTSFAINFFLYLKHRRIIGPTGEDKENQEEIDGISLEGTNQKKRSSRISRQKKGKRKPQKEYFPEEFGSRKEKKAAKKQAAQQGKDAEPSDASVSGKSRHREFHREETPSMLNPTASYLPIQKVENGIIYTKDRRYIKIIEILPINFMLRNAREQKNIIYSFASYLKISPVKLQFKVLTRRADINHHLESIREDMKTETDERCLAMQKDYEALIRRIGSKEAISRRFFLIFEYEPFAGSRNNTEADARSSLQTAVQTASTYLRQCGNEVLVPQNEDEFITDVFYNLLNRKTSTVKPLATRVNEVIGQYINAGRKNDLDHIPANEFFAPESIDFTHGNYCVMDGVYHTYLLIPSNGYRTQVCAGWLSLLVNAGEGIDVDLFFDRQPKDKIQQKLGQQLRINRSKIKETSDTNSDFDDLDSAIRSGYFLKEGLAANEDFYYMNILITVTADSLEELEWRTNEMKKLLLSQDMEAVTCHFREEQAMLSALPLVSLDKTLFARSKRNLLTSGVASCYPYTSFEMCDDNGILLGVNKYNNSLIIVDIFNSKIYKNANITMLGTSGTGKTFTLQLMALRLRRKHIRVFIIAPLKGHEFRRACNNVSGSFIQISPASPNCINIMEIRKTDTSANDLLDGPQAEKSALAAKIQWLHIHFSLRIPDMTYEERQLLDMAIIETYQKKGITHDNKSLEDPLRPGAYREMPILGDLYDVLNANPATKRMANILNRMVHGSGSSFNQQTNVNLDNEYSVLDISELTGDMLVTGMLTALEFVWDKVKEDRTTRKAVFIDEIWHLIGASSNRLAASFVLEIFKTIRGYGGSAICATQDLNDFFALEDGKFGKGIINNSKTKIILNLEDEEAMRVQSLLHLSEAETMAITHFERGNALISTNNNNVTVEFKASELEKELITTDREELKRILERERKQQALMEAV